MPNALENEILMQTIDRRIVAKTAPKRKVPKKGEPLPKMGEGGVVHTHTHTHTQSFEVRKPSVGSKGGSEKTAMENKNRCLYINGRGKECGNG
jgi:hypothetical protein